LLVTSTYLDHIGATELPDRMRQLGPVFSAKKPARAELGELVEKLSDADVEKIVEALRRTASVT